MYETEYIHTHSLTVDGVKTENTTAAVSEGQRVWEGSSCQGILYRKFIWNKKVDDFARFLSSFFFICR